MPDKNKQSGPRTHDVTGLLRQGAATLGIALSQQQEESFLTYLSLLRLWNSKLNLTSIRERELIVRRHFIDSLAIARFLTSDGSILDIGSGAGFPAVPLKIAFPQKSVVLAEPRRKKASFLGEVIRALHLLHITVLEQRAENIETSPTDQFDEVVTRAFHSPELFLRISYKLLGPRGRAIIMHGPKGSELFPSLDAVSMTLGFSRARLESFSLPIGNEQRTVILVEKG